MLLFGRIGVAVAIIDVTELILDVVLVSHYLMEWCHWISNMDLRLRSHMDLRSHMGLFIHTMRRRTTNRTVSYTFHWYCRDRMKIFNRCRYMPLPRVRTSSIGMILDVKVRLGRDSGHDGDNL